MTPEALAAIKARAENNLPRCVCQKCEDIGYLLEALREGEEENARLRATLTRAKDDMTGWGSYASQYFRDKWHLADDLAAIDAALAEPSAEGGQA